MRIRKAGRQESVPKFFSCLPAFLIQRGFACAILWLLLVAGAVSPPSVDAATPAEENAFQAAAGVFQDENWVTAEKWFAEFVQQYPQSQYRAEAVLLLALSRLKQRNHEGAVAMLTAEARQAGVFADRYQFFIAEALLQGGKTRQAAAAYHRVTEQFTNSSHVLDAAYGEAYAYSRLGEWVRVMELLDEPSDAFHRAAKARTGDEVYARGLLLLAEAALEQKIFRAGEDALKQLAGLKLTPEIAWQRQFLQCRILTADNRLTDALAATTNLVALSVALGGGRPLAEAVRFQAATFEGLNRLADAVATYERNLATNAPPEFRRAALLKSIELTLRQEKLAEGTQKLEAFLAQNPQDPAVDVALFTLGEVRLREFYQVQQARQMSNTPALLTLETNLLARAQAGFEQVIKGFPNGPLAGKSFLNLGWCFWNRDQRAESQVAFREAVQRLPVGEEQAVALFKLAETQLQQRDFTNAVQNFSRLLNDYSGSAAVKARLFEPALYKILRAGIDLGDLSVANDALGKILAWYPDSAFADRSMLLLGQALSRQGKATNARAIFVEFLKHFPSSPLVGEVHLAIARTYVEEKDWAAAVGKYDDWFAKFPTNQSRPQAEFDRAWVNFLAGRETNAMTMFTNVVARYPGHVNAPQAQLWVADYFYNQADFVGAEKHYQMLYQNTNCPRALHFQARMMAGRSAVARQSFPDARGYFTALISDPQCPPEVLAEALFAVGDTTILEQAGNAEKPLGKYEEAINAFNKVVQLFPTNAIVAKALGRIGDCHLQLGVQDAKRYEGAQAAYQAVIAMPSVVADVASRSQAEVGLGTVLERVAEKKAATEQGPLVAAALERYLNVVYGKNLREGERPDPFWIKEAGLTAARVLEARGQWNETINLYRRLQDLVPSLRPMLEKKIEGARRSQAEVKGAPRS